MLCADLDRIPAGQVPWADGGQGARREALHRALREAVATALTARQKALVEGYFFEGLSQGDLARKLGVAQQVVQKALFGTVRRGKRVGGALSRLRAVLAPHIGPRGATEIATAHLETAHLETAHLETPHVRPAAGLGER